MLWSEVDKLLADAHRLLWKEIEGGGTTGCPDHRVVPESSSKEARLGQCERYLRRPHGHEQ